MESSKQHLLKLGAVTEATGGHLTATQLGQVLVSLPISIEFGISIVAAVQHKCSREVAVIACMATAAGNRVFQHNCQPTQSVFAAKSGDPEMYLNVYQAWIQNSKSSVWCRQHQLVESALVAAQDMLGRVLEAMARCNLAVMQLSITGDPVQRSNAIMQSLTTGFFQQTATAASQSDADGRFFVTDQYLTSPTHAVLHNRSSLSAADGNAIGMILYFDHILTANGRHILAGVGKIQPAWVVAAAAFDPLLASRYQQTIHATEREQFHIILSSFPRMVSTTSLLNIMITTNSQAAPAVIKKCAWHIIPLC